MSKTREELRADRLLWWGVGVFVVGRIVDLIWHATHPEFETAADQLQAHSVVWPGALLMIVAAARASASEHRNGGYLLVLSAGLAYGAVAVWHFYEHSQGRDPDLPHLLLLVTNIAMFLGAGWVWLTARRARRAAPTNLRSRPISPSDTL
jgi:hypothetical protein